MTNPRTFSKQALERHLIRRFNRYSSITLILTMRKVVAEAFRGQLRLRRKSMTVRGTVFERMWNWSAMPRNQKNFSVSSWKIIGRFHGVVSKILNFGILAKGSDCGRVLCVRITVWVLAKRRWEQYRGYISYLINLYSLMPFLHGLDSRGAAVAVLCVAPWDSALV